MALDLVGVALGIIAESNAKSFKFTVYRVCDNNGASCINGRSWSLEDPTLMGSREEWRNRYAVYPSWNAGTHYVTGYVTFHDLLTGRVLPTIHNGSTAGPRPYDPRLGGGPYVGDGHEWFIPNPEITVQNPVIRPYF